MLIDHAVLLQDGLLLLEIASQQPILMFQALTVVDPGPLSHEAETLGETVREPDRLHQEDFLQDEIMTVDIDLHQEDEIVVRLQEGIGREKEKDHIQGTTCFAGRYYSTDTPQEVLPHHAEHTLHKIAQDQSTVTNHHHVATTDTQPDLPTVNQTQPLVQHLLHLSIQLVLV
jgi:hypothetical protein